MWQAEVYVTFKRGVLDPQGETIRSSLVALGFETVSEVRVGKFMTVKLSASSRETARSLVDDMCRRLLSNPVIEEYRFDLRPLDREV
jgi:phosphoribosylformylglycinamidine synthase